MKSEKIVVFKEVGVSCDKMLKLLLDYKPENLNQFLKDAEIIKYPAPGIADTEGHEIEGYLQLQELDGMTHDWVNTDNPESHAPKRQIWVLSQKVEVKDKIADLCKEIEETSIRLTNLGEALKIEIRKRFEPTH